MCWFKKIDGAQQDRCIRFRSVGVCLLWVGALSWEWTSLGNLTWISYVEHLSYVYYFVMESQSRRL